MREEFTLRVLFPCCFRNSMKCLILNPSPFETMNTDTKFFEPFLDEQSRKCGLTLCSIELTRCSFESMEHICERGLLKKYVQRQIKIRILMSIWSNVGRKQLLPYMPIYSFSFPQQLYFLFVEINKILSVRNPTLIVNENERGLTKIYKGHVVHLLRRRDLLGCLLMWFTFCRHDMMSLLVGS